ncbi:MAG: LysR family transcriptional regulator [Alphaproteobacteria bacterium]|nr:LysR family transcriptional regulator [Alphaproteobacteria bacterium]
MTERLDWTHLQSFIAVAEHGSLSGAARALGGSQPTMGRHVAALEAALGVRLFDRTAGGLALTPTGADLLDHAGPMGQAANRVALAAQGRSEAIAGTNRLTASEIVATYVLPGILAELHQLEPEIQIELVASDRTENLLRRDADIAVRMYQPTQADVIARKVAELPMTIWPGPGCRRRWRISCGTRSWAMTGANRLSRAFAPLGLRLTVSSSASVPTIRWPPGTWSWRAGASASTKP